MASHYQHHPHPHFCQHQPPPPPSAAAAIHCCCNPSSHCCPPPPPSTDHLVQAIASLLSQSDPLPPHLYAQCSQIGTHNTNRLRQQEQQAHSTIASLLCRIEALESSLHRVSSSHSYHQSSCYSLRDTAARVIQIHFRAFLVRRSRTLRQLKELGIIKSAFNSLNSSLSNGSHVDFAALSRKAMDLLLQLDSIEGEDPMIRDGKRSISRDLIHLLDFIEGVAAEKQLRLVKATKKAKSVQNINKSRVLNSKHGNLGHDQRKLLDNLRGRVDRISRLCKLSANAEEDAKSEGTLHVSDDNDDNGDPCIVISSRNGVPPTKDGVQPKVKKSVSFAESGNVSKIYSNTYEPILSEDVACMDGSSSSDEQEDVLENIRNEVEDVMDSSRRAEDDEEAIPDNGRSAQSSDGERNGKRHLNKDVRTEKPFVFAAPWRLRMGSQR